MADFLEERISADILTGAGYQDDYSVYINSDSGGTEYRSLYHPFPVRKFDISYLLEKQGMWAQLLNLYHRAHGMYGGFRIRAIDDYKSCATNQNPTAFDQPLTELSAGVYEMRKYYGTDKTAGATGYPHRKIKKPVAGTVKFAIGSVEMAVGPSRWEVDTTTGLITLPANGTAPITGISKAATARISIGALSGAINAGQTVYISGVSGMTQINNMRAMVTYVGAGYIDVSVDSTGFSTWTSGGVVNTRRQAGEQVTCGFEFDTPVRFNTTLPVGQDHFNHRSIDGIELIELLNP